MNEGANHKQAGGEKNHEETECVSPQQTALANTVSAQDITICAKETLQGGIADTTNASMDAANENGNWREQTVRHRTCVRCGYWHRVASIRHNIVYIIRCNQCNLSKFHSFRLQKKGSAETPSPPMSASRQTQASSKSISVIDGWYWSQYRCDHAIW